MNLEAIQRAIREEGLDGWLFFDHHVRDPLAYRVLGLDASHSPTRRWYYFIPSSGEPRGLVHRIEAGVLDSLPGPKEQYSSWSTQADGLKTLLGGACRVAMQYSPNCAIFYVSMVDAGTVELIRSLGVDVVSSANHIQFFEARWDQAKLESHLEAGHRIDAIRKAAFEFIAATPAVDEYVVQQFIRSAFDRDGLVTDHGPIVAVNENCSNPHYEPSASSTRPIRRGDFVLIDMWAKLKAPSSVYYDITWTGYYGPSVPDEMQNVFEVVRGARDRHPG